MEHSRWVFYVVAVSAGLVGALADGCLNRWAKSSGTWWWILAGVVLWNIALAMFTYILRQGHHLARCAALFATANGALILLLCFLVFREKLSFTSWVGITIVFLGVVIAEVGR